ncbi:hypothetical protein N658DRAFT_432079 [Parathielavia hyrcaniae]|uniref:NACHT domain-containing protein n=1 Tax=Parathielavia hyrcaniae TaxID=113614 RepID=A0AAN6SZ69_9PEZI|nr:hypothetical protein N658DRAFT_432079 [Parathielavia hyrcaniae]
MEPLSALGIAAAGVQFVDFGSRFLRDTIEIYKSTLGQTERVAILARATSTLHDLSSKVEEKAAALPANAISGSADAMFLDTCRQCRDVSKELTEVIAALGANLAAAVRALKASGIIGSLSRKLESIRVQMETVTLICVWAKATENGESTLRVSQQLVDAVATLERVEATIKHTARSLNDIAKDSGTAENSDDNLDRRVRRRKIVDALWGGMWTPSPSGCPPLRHPEDPTTFAIARGGILASLAFDSMRDRQETIPKAYADTFAWLFEAPATNRDGQASPWSSFPAWLEEHTRDIYWITGKPGAGKSTLMKFLTSHPRLRQHLSVWSPPDQLVVASFYLWNAGAGLQKSHEGLMRSLLHQCLDQRPDLLPRVCQRRWACLQMLGPDAWHDFPPWEWGELVDCFRALVSQAGAGYRLVLFIDGLDEFDGDHNKLVETIKDHSQWEHVKICVSSRPWNVFNDAFQRSPSLMVQDLTMSDVQRYVRGHFENLPAFTELQLGDPDTAATLLQDIASRADGVFLWVAVVVRTLARRLSAGDSFADLFATLSELPRDVKELYEVIRRQIDPSYLSQSARYFLLLLDARQTPHTPIPSAVTFLLADEDEESRLHLDFSKTSVTGKSWMVATMRRRLSSRTMGLLEISPANGTVGFLHRTVLEWASQTDNLANIKRDAPEDFNPNLELCKARTTELLNGHLGLARGSHQRLADTAGDTAKRFWELLILCLRHAAHAGGCDARSDARLARMLGRLETQLPRLIISLGIRGVRLGQLPEAITSIGDPGLFQDLSQRSNWIEHPHPFVRLAAGFAILPFVKPRLTSNFYAAGMSTSVGSYEM